VAAPSVNPGDPLGDAGPDAGPLDGCPGDPGGRGAPDPGAPDDVGSRWALPVVGAGLDGVSAGRRQPAVQDAASPPAVPGHASGRPQCRSAAVSDGAAVPSGRALCRRDPADRAAAVPRCVIGAPDPPSGRGRSRPVAPGGPRPPAAGPSQPSTPAQRPRGQEPSHVERRQADPAARPAPRGGTEPTAVAALVAALVGIVVPLVGILAIVLGGIGAERARRRGTGGRGIARTATVLGSIQVVVTTLAVVGGLLLWNAVADDLRRGLDQLDGVAVPEFSLPELALDGITGDLSLDDVTDILGTVGQAGELGDLADQCQSGDLGACDSLVGQIPENLLPSP
jgi:hypothetical protein